MFQAVRDYFARPDDPPAWRGRGRRHAALFLFEFVVVVLGVLVAQSLQDYASELRDRSDMRVQRARADFQIADSRSTSEYWLVLAPCLSSRMDRVMLAVAAGAAPAPQDIATPPFFTSRISPWSEQSVLTLRRQEGDKVAAHYVSLVDIAGFQTDHVRRVAHEWAPLELMNPGHGAPTESDRAAARLAASRVKAELERVAANANSIIRRASALGIVAATVDPMPDLPPNCRAAGR